MLLLLEPEIVVLERLALLLVPSADLEFAFEIPDVFELPAECAEVAECSITFQLGAEDACFDSPLVLEDLPEAP